MPLKDPERRREYHTKYMKEVWYPKNKSKHIDYVKRNKQRVRTFIDQYKRERACMDCGFSGRDYPFVLDFDHQRDIDVKKFNIGSWMRAALSIAAVKREIEKCELVCANCHRIRTFSSNT